MSVLVFAFARRKEGRDEVDARERQVRADIAKLHEGVDARMAAAFARIDSIRADLAALTLDIARHTATKDDLKGIAHEQTQRVGNLEGKLDNLLDMITSLRERTASHGKRESI